MYNSLTVSHASGVVKVVLNRPESYNALNKELLSELNGVFNQLDSDPSVKVIVLAGEGKGFCAGQDLKMLDFSTEKVLAAEIIEHYYKPVIKAIAYNSKPVICKLHGSATGAGMSLALACDQIIASETASLTAGFVKIGLMPDSGITYFLINQIGQKKAFQILASGDKISASEGLALGLISKVVPDAELDKAIEEAVSLLSSAPPIVLRNLKKLLKDSNGQSMVKVIELEAKAQDIAANSEDFKEGVKAFLEKRKPDFKGY